MTQQRARRLVDEARNAIVSTEEQLLLHSYAGALEKKVIGKGKLSLVAVQQNHLLGNSINALELALARSSSPCAKEFLSASLDKTRDAHDALRIFGKAIGLSAEELDAMEPLSGAIAYSLYLYWLASKRTASEIAAAFLVNMPLWGANCVRVGRALQANYGFKKEDVAFFEMFADPSPGFGEMALAAVEEGLEQGVDPVFIRRSVRLLQRYELMFWDTMWERSRS